MKTVHFFALAALLAMVGTLSTASANTGKPQPVSKAPLVHINCGSSALLDTFTENPDRPDVDYTVSWHGQGVGLIYAQTETPGYPSDFEDRALFEPLTAYDYSLRLPVRGQPPNGHRIQVAATAAPCYANTYGLDVSNLAVDWVH